MRKYPIMQVALLSIISPVVFAGGTLGGNPSSNSGAININTGKCVVYEQKVKTAKQKGERTSIIAVPKGCKRKT